MIAEIQGEDLIVRNHRANEVYHVIFRSEVLALIEWTPCGEPERCDASQRIEAGGEKSYLLDSLIELGSQELSLFWWELAYDESSAGYRWPEV